MKNKVKLVGFLCFMALFANIFFASAAVGVEVGDTYKYDWRADVIDGTDEYALEAKLEIEITAIGLEIEVFSISMVKISFNMTYSNFVTEGDIPEDEEELPEEETLENSVNIYDDDESTNTSIASGAFFIDADYTPKTIETNMSAYGIEIAIESEYDEDGVLLNTEMTMKMEALDYEMVTTITRAKSGIPGFPTLLFGIISIVSIPIIGRKVRK